MLAHIKQAMILSASLCLLGCGGGGNGADESGEPSDRTTIEGRVSSVAGGAAGSALGSQVSGIRVEVRRNGQILDAANTDVDGRFTLEFIGGGTVDLVFVTGPATLSLEVTAPPGSVITLVVELDIADEEVVVVEESGPIRCESGRFSIDDEGLDLVIDGRGDDCLRVENDCVLDLALRSLTMVNCDRCIDAQSSAEVVITTVPGGVTCRARDDGIRAQSSSFVLIDARDDVEIVAGSGSAIRAESSAEVVLVADGRCFIEAEDDPIRIESQAIVDVNGCAEIVLVDDSDDDFDDDDFDDDDFDDDDFDDDDD